MLRLQLPSVTLCAASSVNISATVAALLACVDQIDFAECLLLTDAEIIPPDPIRIVPVKRLESGRDYSQLLLHELVNHVSTSHCLIVQWDGFVTNAKQWDPRFLDFDYIGAPWPQFRDGHDVGNGGFSLRSLRLLQACQDPLFKDGHPEDVAICRTNRPLLESEHEICFADRTVAEAFSLERGWSSGSFGFHGVFNMIPVLGVERFWKIYRELDDRGTIGTDFTLIFSQLRAGGDVARRRVSLIADLLGAQIRRLMP